ncbi:MAG TPA: PAS domain S-box protein [Myxococcota bacterium]|nr:PAS domain S-box protein [Myxococcota bacterium]
MTTSDAPPASVSSDPALDPELGALARRPARAPDLGAENRVLVALARCVTTSPKDVLQKLVEAAQELCRADSAGLSVLEQEGDRRILRWQAATGPLARHRQASPDLSVEASGLVVQHNAPLLLERPARRFAFLGEISPPVHEALLVPLPPGGSLTGALWVLAHDERRAFDGEDARLLDTLAHFASAAHRMLSAAPAVQEARRESQQLAAALRRRDLELRRLLEFLPVGACTCDAEGRITFSNRAAGRLWGRKPVPGEPIDHYAGSLRLFAGDGTPLAPEPGWIGRVLRDGAAYHGREILLERPDGSRVPALVHASPILDDEGFRIGAIALFVDISKGKRTQEALHESEQRFARFMHHLPGLAWIKDLEGRYLFVNEATERAFQRTRAEIYGRTDAEILPRDTAERFTRNDRQALATAAGMEAVETLEHADGSHHSLVSKFPIPGTDGRPALLGGIAIDITERVRAEEALRTSEQIYRAIGESIDFGVWVCDPEGRNVYASESFLKLVGMTQEQCSNQGWVDVLHPDEARATLASWQECVRSRRQWDVEHRLRGADGRWHPVLARGVPVQNERGETTAWAGINLDISRRKQIEEELREADRRKDEFLATLAHELRNPLAPIRNSLSVLRLAGANPGAERIY